MKRTFIILLFIPFISNAQVRGYNGLCTQTNTWKTACTNYPAPLTVYGINQVIETALNDSTWNTLDCAEIYAQNDSTNSLRSIINPTIYIAKTMKNPTWTQYQGWNGDGSKSYLNTNYNTSAGTNFTLSSHSWGVGNLTITTGTYDGIYNTSNTWLLFYYQTLSVFRIYDGNVYENSSASSSRGLFVSVSNGGNLYSYFNKTRGLNDPITNQLLNYTIFLGTNNGSSIGSIGYNNIKHAFFFAGSALTPTMEAHLADNLNKYMAEVGNNLY